MGISNTPLIACTKIIQSMVFTNNLMRVLLSVRQLLSLYLRFYKVTMLESTNATDEGRMRMYV